MEAVRWLDDGRELMSLDSRASAVWSLDFLAGLGQPQTFRIHRAMLTSCFMTSTIHGCVSMSFGVGRLVESTLKLKALRLAIVSNLFNGPYVCEMKSFISALH